MTRNVMLGFGLRLLLDKRGLISASFILFIWIYGHIIVLLPILLPHFKDQNISYVTIGAYLFLSINTIIAFFRAMLTDPGKVANVNKEMIDWRTWEKCVRCCMARPPRSHHCSRCGFCVLRMDHHCQWINNCVGAKNHWIFYMLLVYASLFVINNIALYHFHLWGWLGICKSCVEVTWIDPLGDRTRYFSYFIATLAFVGINLLLLLTSMHLALDYTTIESLQDPQEMMSRAVKHRKIIPRREIVSKLCGTRNVVLWFIPFRLYSHTHGVESEPITV